MSDQPVTPDREALIEAAVRGFADWANAERKTKGPMAAVVDALLPLFTDALDRARQQGRDEAAEAIDGSAEGKFVRVKDYCYRWADDDEPDSGCGESPCPGHDNGDGHHVYFGKGYFAALARGGPNRKDEETP